jgi:hypothetical protein
MIRNTGRSAPGRPQNSFPEKSSGYLEERGCRLENRRYEGGWSGRVGLRGCRLENRRYAPGGPAGWSVRWDGELGSNLFHDSRMHEEGDPFFGCEAVLFGAAAQLELAAQKFHDLGVAKGGDDVAFVFEGREMFAGSFLKG